jgi:lipoate synthase
MTDWRIWGLEDVIPKFTVPILVLFKGSTSSIACVKQCHNSTVTHSFFISKEKMTYVPETATHSRSMHYLTPKKTFQVRHKKRVEGGRGQQEKEVGKGLSVRASNFL